MPETIDKSGAPVLATGFVWGSSIESRMGLPPSELLNIGSAEDRQRVFYKGIAQLGSPDSSYLNYWRPNGAMGALISEFTVAAENAKMRAGVVVPERVMQSYQQKIIAYMSCMGLASGIMHCDGAMGTLAEQIMPQEHELDKGWDKYKSDLLLHDPAISFPLTWIRDHSTSGVLPYYWYRESSMGDKTAIPEYVGKLADAMARDRSWQVMCQARGIPAGIEKSLVKIALAYHIVEDLPILQSDLKAGRVSFTDPRAFVRDQSGQVKSIADPSKSNCGFLPFDNVFFATFRDPTGILRFKQIFPNRPDIISAIDRFFSFADNEFGDGAKRMSDKRPYEISVKDAKRFGKVWDLLVGGSQGSSMADFSKFGEAIYALCNLYNMPGQVDRRADVVGWMVGEAVYIKTMALMAGVPDGEAWAQLARVLSLGPLDTPQELERVSAGVLGAQGTGFFGALQVIEQFGLKVGTEHFNQAVAMLKTGIKDPNRAIAGQAGLVVAAFLNRFIAPGVGGAKRK
jgi:hypothetical protein